MGWVIRTHDGKELSIKQNDENRIKELAKRLELVPVTLLNGTIQYIKPSNVSRLEYVHEQKVVPENLRLEQPDNHGSESPAKEKLRQQLKDKGIL